MALRASWMAAAWRARPCMASTVFSTSRQTIRARFLPSEPCGGSRYAISSLGFGQPHAYEGVSLCQSNPRPPRTMDIIEATRSYEAWMGRCTALVPADLADKPTD